MQPWARSFSASLRQRPCLCSPWLPPLLPASPKSPAAPEGRPSFRFFGSEQGLPQNTPQSFALDARGFLWTGTQDGAAVYNGRSWKTVDMPNREESNSILDILAGADGSMWFATTIGLARLHDGRWTLFRKDAGLPSNRIQSLAEERDGAGRTVLWAGTDKGLAHWNGKAWTVVDARPPAFPASGSPRSSLSRPDQGPVLWVGTGSGLARRAGGRWTTFPAGAAGSGPPKAAVTDLLETRDGGRSILWVATDGGGLVQVRRRTLDGGEGAPQRPRAEPPPPRQRKRETSCGPARPGVWRTGPAGPGPSTTPRTPACRRIRSCAFSPAGAAAGLSCGSA